MDCSYCMLTFLISVITDPASFGCAAALSGDVIHSVKDRANKVAEAGSIVSGASCASRHQIATATSVA